MNTYQEKLAAYLGHKKANKNLIRVFGRGENAYNLAKIDNELRRVGLMEPKPAKEPKKTLLDVINAVEKIKPSTEEELAALGVDADEQDADTGTDDGVEELPVDEVVEAVEELPVVDEVVEKASDSKKKPTKA
jgi:hypothetical protein